jgi:hypothetical protein
LTPFYTGNVLHAGISVETSPLIRKTQPFVVFDGKYVTSFPIEIHRRFEALFTPFYTANVVNDDFSVETSPAFSKRILSSISMITVVSFLIEIYRRLNALFTPFYKGNVLHADFSFETIPANRKMQTFVDFDKNLLFRS